jgi:hypothetical protein
LSPAKKTTQTLADRSLELLEEPWAEEASRSQNKNFSNPTIGPNTSSPGPNKVEFERQLDLKDFGAQTKNRTKDSIFFSQSHLI